MNENGLEVIVEARAVGISEPWVCFGALLAGEQEHLVLVGEVARHLVGAGVWQVAEGQTLDVALSFPFLEVVDGGNLSGSFHPVDGLLHRHEVVVALLGGLVHPVGELLEEVLARLEEGRGEVETQRGAVGAVVAGQVVVQEGAELLGGDNVGALVDVVATGQLLVELRVVTTIELVHHHLPDGEVAGRAVLVSSETLVGHTVHEGVWPQGQTALGSGNGGVVEEAPFHHHLELRVATNSAEGHAHAQDLSGGDVGEALDDDTGAVHLLLVVLGVEVGPVGGVGVVGDGVDGDLVALAVELLDGGVVGEGVGDEEGTLGSAVIALVLGGILEDLLEDAEVALVDGAGEGDGDHLGRLRGVQVAGDVGAVHGAEAALVPAAGAGVADLGAVGVRLGGADVLIRSVVAVGDAVTEQLLPQTLSGSALDVRAGAVGHLAFGHGPSGLGQAALLELGAVEHLVPALANLLFNIEEQAGGAVVLAEGLLASWSRDAAVIHSAELAGLIFKHISQVLPEEFL